MRPLQTFYQYTMELIDLLENQPEIQRDEKIQIIEDLLEKRNELMPQIQPPYSNEEKELGVKTIKLNEKFVQLLNKEKLMIQADIKKLNYKKESSNKYVNPYQNTMTDGVFYDKRK